MQQSGDGVVTVVTFNPHPQQIVGSYAAPPPLLTSFDERLALFRQLQVDRLIIIPFNEDFARIEAVDFIVDILIDKIGMSGIYTGPRHRFGKGGKGNIELLRRVGRERGFTVKMISPVIQDGEPISSSRIRRLLLAGDVLTGMKFTGRPFFIVGEVVRGDGRGRELDFPTANLEAENKHKLKPNPGIYATITEIDGVEWQSVSHFGSRPTFPDAKPSMETHIIGFDGDLYGKMIRVGLIDRLRGIEAFSSVRELVDRMEQDREMSIKRLGELGFTGGKVKNESV